jgi:AraC-like DNA-binding protein
MQQDEYFITQKPSNQFLSTIVDYYFYIDASLAELSLNRELIIPFPRINFLFFFDQPFLVTNHTLNESVLTNMAISRISSDKISVQPQGDRVKVLGAHVSPFCLAYFTRQPIGELPWLINTINLFQKIAIDFQQRIEQCSDYKAMFLQIEKTFLDNILIRNVSIITAATELIEKSMGDIELTELSSKLRISDRTIRTYFYNYVGCSPKEYARLVKLRQSTYQMKYSNDSLTTIAYDNNYFDQAHFIHEVKNMTGCSPNILRKEMPHFRFLQF